MLLIQRCLGVLGISLGLFFMPHLVPSAYSQSCEAECGIITEDGCACDNECTMFGDCCADKAQFCDAPPPEQDQPVVGDTEPPVFAGTVAAHNTWRAQVGSQPLGWNNELATVAQQWADQLATTGGCRLAHRTDLDTVIPGSTLGENLYIKGASPNAPIVTPKEAVDSWGSEIQFYDAATHTCNAPAGESCGHYTQVVWKDTTEVGCGTATCASGDFQNVIWVCNYRPAGNVAGQTPFP